MLHKLRCKKCHTTVSVVQSWFEPRQNVYMMYAKCHGETDHIRIPRDLALSAPKGYVFSVFTSDRTFGRIVEVLDREDVHTDINVTEYFKPAVVIPKTVETVLELKHRLFMNN